uniref:Superoxide dismutase n=1 Tax=candidate division WWE3 bacterium TaxID=2053526 RepID=A0A7C4TS03_UNCKA
MAETFKLPTLKYSFEALEPHIDAKTMEIHLTKHHAAYVTNLNKTLENYPDLQTKTIEEILTNLESVPQDIKQAVINHGGGHANHSLFWEIMSPEGSRTPNGELAEKIEKTFVGFDNFKQEFAKAAVSRFGSGWAWLTVNGNGDLSIMSTPNQDSPLSQGLKPVLGLDVWEHAYYLNYQNRRPDYIEAFWNLVDWDEVGRKLTA